VDIVVREMERPGGVEARQSKESPIHRKTSTALLTNKKKDDTKKRKKEKKRRRELVVGYRARKNTGL